MIRTRRVTVELQIPCNSLNRGILKRDFAEDRVEFMEACRRKHFILYYLR